MYFFDSTYILILIGVIIASIASFKVKSTYKKYAKVMSDSNISAVEVARYILDTSGLQDIRIERVSGDLTDHYSPKERILRLSDTTYNSRSVAAIGVAAHECGHAIQHKTGYLPIKIRNFIVPIVNLGTSLAWPIIIIGLIFSYVFVELGIFLFSFGLIFQLITLPVEFNASSRALKILKNTSILNYKEIKSAKKVLSAAAMTYVAAAISSALSLLRLVLLYGGRDD